MSHFVPYVPINLISERLPQIFPEGTPHRNYCVRDLAASTIFAALYIGAVEGSGIFFGPKHVYRMTEEQARLSADGDRNAYLDAIKTGKLIEGTRWYADNTREPIRDETLRDGLIPTGAVVRREGIATTSGLPRYALKAEFARLFDPTLTGSKLTRAINDFQKRNLTRGALARITLMRAGAIASGSTVTVSMPNGERRNLTPGPSSEIAKAVVERFATRYLTTPAVLWLSESGRKIVLHDDQLATSIGLTIPHDRVLPDLILVDLLPGGTLIVFVEIVATDGAVTVRRQEELFSISDSAGYDRRQVAFLTAYSDRESPGFRKTATQLAWNSFAWFASEPEHIIVLRSGAEKAVTLSELIAQRIVEA